MGYGAQQESGLDMCSTRFKFLIRFSSPLLCSPLSSLLYLLYLLHTSLIPTYLPTYLYCSSGASNVLFFMSLR